MPGYNDESLALKTAKAWGLCPLEWRQQPLDDQARMMAFELFEGTRDGYAAQWHEDHPKGGKGGHAEREFKAMQRRPAPA